MANKTCEVCGDIRDEQRMILHDEHYFCSSACVSTYYSAQCVHACAATVTKINSSATGVTLISANEARKMATIYNNSSAVLYVKYGTPISSDSFTVAIPKESYLELPYPCYTGQIDGYWGSVNGNAMVTEIE